MWKDFGGKSRLNPLTVTPIGCCAPPPIPMHEYELLEWIFISDIPGVYCEGTKVISIMWENTASLYHDRLVGSLPELTGKLKNLESLYIANNSISGSIPQSITNLENLAILDIANNRISGLFPQGFTRLTNLEELHIEGNSFADPIPPLMEMMPNLKIFTSD